MVALAGEYQGNTTEAISEPCVSTTTTSDIVDEVRVVKEHKTTNPLPRWWIPVPLVIVMMASTVTDHVLLNDLFIKRYRYEYHISTASSFPYNTQCMLRNTSEIDSIIQEKTAHLNVILGWSGIGPALVAYVLLGANCDLIGRRPLIIIPFIGKVIRYALLMVFITFNWSDRWLISAHVIDNVFGSSAVMMLGALSYISDCTTEKTRSRAFLIQEIVGALTHFFTLLGLGFWLQGHGYVLPVAISLCMNSAALLYAGFFQPESRVLESVWRQLKRIRLRSVLGTYRVFLVKRPGYHQQYIILLTFAHIILFLTHISFISIHPLYLYGRPFCFTALGLAILTSGRKTMNSMTLLLMFSYLIDFGLVIPILLAFSLYQRQLDTPLLPLVSTSFYIVHIALFGAAKQVVTLYVGEQNDRSRTNFSTFFISLSWHTWCRPSSCVSGAALSDHETRQR